MIHVSQQIDHMHLSRQGYESESDTQGNAKQAIAFVGNFLA